MISTVASGGRLYSRLFRQARPFSSAIALSLMVNLTSGPIALLAPVPLKIAVDSVIGSHPVPRLLTFVLPRTVIVSKVWLLVATAGLVLGIALLEQTQVLAAATTQALAGEKLTMAFRAQIFGHAQRLSVCYHDTKGTSDALYRIQYDAASIQYILIDGLVAFLTSACTIGGMIFVTARLDWQLAAVALGVAPVFFLCSRAQRCQLRRHSRQMKKMESVAMGTAQEALTSLRVVKAFVQEDREQRRFLTDFGVAMRARLRLAIIEGGYRFLLGSLAAVGTAAAILIGVGHVRAGTLSLGGLLLVMGYLAQMYAPLKTMSGKAGSLQTHLAGAERAFALLDEPTDVPERPHARPVVRAQGDVAFHNVTFAYADRNPVLRDINFEVRAGTRLGIIGATGSGKTTLISLLMRFFDPISGAILMDGIDLRAYKVADLRNQFAIVLQEPVLFSATIAENIAFACPEANSSEIVAAAAAANAHDFISRLPMGYDTPVGERGMQLSGGERQRISLARAFLKNAPILILDEPTSAVDVDTETAILEAMERLARGRTSFVITHRMSLVKYCDQLLRIERGSVVLPGAIPADRNPNPDREAPAVMGGRVRA